MKGVVIRKARLAHEDERRSMLEIMNGEMAVKNMKVLHIKKGEQVLGNHWHQYPEVMYVLKGSVRYKMKNLDTGEEEEHELVEGDVVFRTGRIVHAGYFHEGSIILDCGAETYISPAFNDITHKIL